MSSHSKFTEAFDLLKPTKFILQMFIEYVHMNVQNVHSENPKKLLKCEKFFEKFEKFSSYLFWDYYYSP